MRRRIASNIAKTAGAFRKGVLTTGLKVRASVFVA
jgi:hypothetical protein